MLLSQRKAVTTTMATIVIIAVILVAAVAYFAIVNTGGSTSSTSSPSSSSSSSSSTQANKVLKILMFTTTPATTAWGSEITRGLNQAVAALNNTNGYTIETTTAFNIGYSDAQSFMSSYASQGYNLIIPNDVGYVSAAQAVAAQFPNVDFWGPTFDSILAANVGAWSIDHWKGEYMAGVVAGLMTKTNKIGFEDAFQYSQTIEAINAFEYGAKLVNPNVVIYYAFSGSWSDSVKGASAASALAADGADVIACFGDSNADGCISGAQTAGVYAIGYLHDANSLAPKTVLTSVMLNTTAYYMKAIVATENHQIGYKFYILSIYPDHVTALTPLYNVPADKAATAATWINKILSGQLVPQNNQTLPSQGGV